LTNLIQIYYNGYTIKYGFLLLTDHCGKPQGNKNLGLADRLGNIWFHRMLPFFVGEIFCFEHKGEINELSSMGKL
jgi:hypothetical protein